MLEYDIAEYSQINPDLYRRELRKLQAEFLKLQKWVIKEKKKIRQIRSNFIIKLCRSFFQKRINALFCII